MRGEGKVKEDHGRMNIILDNSKTRLLHLEDTRILMVRSTVSNVSPSIQVVGTQLNYVYQLLVYYYLLWEYTHTHIH